MFDITRGMLMIAVAAWTFHYGICQILGTTVYDALVVLLPDSL